MPQYSIPAMYRHNKYPAIYTDPLMASAAAHDSMYTNQHPPPATYTLQYSYMTCTQLTYMAGYVGKRVGGDMHWY